MEIRSDVLIVGASASGVCAAIQAARMGANVVLVEETDWVGGMLTAAGVSAIDGNHKLPSGLWGEFREKLYAYYGGPEAVETGWVSNVQFEPKVGEKILREMLKEAGNIDLKTGFYPIEVISKDKKVLGVKFKNDGNEQLEIRAKVTIDATEYGDVLALAGCEFRNGREAFSETGEPGTPSKADNYVQDLTYVAVLEDFGSGADATIPKPDNYDPEEFRGCCKDWAKGGEKGLVDKQAMINYGRLPNNKYMINWPIEGNDYYCDLAVLSRSERAAEIEKAKEVTRRFVYFLQTELGFRNLGPAKDEFPTDDGLALIPYIRESRRVKGVVTLKLQDIVDPYADPSRPLYRQGIAVGNYPLDHHHGKADLPEEETYLPVPAFNVPYGCLIPQDADGLIVAEKSISVTHMVNGCSRLQPVVMQIGQAAGAAAALAVKQNRNPRHISIRELQQTLIEAGMWLMPFTDITPEHWAFKALQRIALCGLLKGEGKAKDWANEFYIYPDNPVYCHEMISALRSIDQTFINRIDIDWEELGNAPLTRIEAVRILWQALGKPSPVNNGEPVFFKDVQDLAVDYFVSKGWAEHWVDFKNELFYPNEPMTRAVFAFLLNAALDPFNRIKPESENR
ncbi:MAG: FAD-dependent oxidoreductase [Calditrichaeota bacterium]|nr:FAD-dependent oxidoreductase [Calditrichota bacterium]